MLNKYEIIYSHQVESKLDDFIDYVWDTCRYRNTWLYDEDLIVDNFINDIKQFVRDLRNEIEKKIYSWIFR